MKTSRFSELDLARFISFAGDLPTLELALRRYRADGGSWPYEPVRASTADILGATTPLHGPMAPVPWTDIERTISVACKYGEPQVSSCLEVGQRLFEEARKRNWNAVQFPMGRMPIGIDESVRYWLDVVVAEDDFSFIPFVDNRRSRGASNLAIQRVIYSMQHIWVRERNPDLGASRLGIVRFSNASRREMSVTFHDGHMPLLSYEELDARARLVYETWGRVLSTRPAKKRTGTDDTPDMFG